MVAALALGGASTEAGGAEEAARRRAEADAARRAEEERLRDGDEYCMLPEPDDLKERNVMISVWSNSDLGRIFVWLSNFFV